MVGKEAQDGVAQEGVSEEMEELSQADCTPFRVQDSVDDGRWEERLKTAEQRGSAAWSEMLCGELSPAKTMECRGERERERERERENKGS